MGKKSQAKKHKSFTQKLKQLSKKQQIAITIVVILILMALGIAGNISINAYLDYKDEQRFLAVEDDVDELAKRLKDAMPNLDWERKNICDRGNIKFREGTATCLMSVRTTADVSSEKEANEKINQFSQVILNSKDTFTATESYRKLSHSPNFPQGLTSGASGQGFMHNTTNMVCGTLFKIDEAMPGTLTLYFDCNGSARQLWL